MKSGFNLKLQKPKLGENQIMQFDFSKRNKINNAANIYKILCTNLDLASFRHCHLYFFPIYTKFSSLNHKLYSKSPPTPPKKKESFTIFFII